jgi:hypothetical protein
MVINAKNVEAMIGKTSVAVEAGIQNRLEADKKLREVIYETQSGLHKGYFIMA